VLTELLANTVDKQFDAAAAFADVEVELLFVEFFPPTVYSEQAGES
jgi:hypothetical protein